MTQYWQSKINQRLIFRPIGLLYFVIFFSGISIISCKNTDSDLGLNLRPDKGELYSAETDTFTVNAFTVREDSLKTDSLSTNILGAMVDPDFGMSTAGVASQLTITQIDLNFGTAPKVDSAMLYIRWDKDYFYGNLNSNQSMTIYYLKDSISSGLKYYSDISPLLGEEIGVWNGSFNLKDSVTIKEKGLSVKKAPGLLIKLNKKVGEDFAKASPSVYGSVSAFKTFVKGIVFVPQSSGLASGQGAIAGVDFFTGNSQLVVHYNDTSQHSFVFNNNCENYNMYNTAHTNPDLLTQFANPSKHYNTTYIQSMGGCKTKIEIPYILNLCNSALPNERIIINEAAFVLTPQNGSISSSYGLPFRLYLLQPDITTKLNSPILDFIDFVDPKLGTYSIYGGGYNSLTNEYTIRFTRHLQHLLDQFKINGTNLNRGFFVTIPSDKPITPTRVILNNTRMPNYKALKFRVTYSKIKI